MVPWMSQRPRTANMGQTLSSVKTSDGSYILFQ